MIDSLKWAPPGFTPWILERDQSPGMANIRENRTYAREVAVKLIEDKKQELNDGTPQRDLLSLLGLSFVPFAKARYTAQHSIFFSQGEFLLATRLAAER